MSHFARNIRDAAVEPAAWALPSAASSSTYSDDVDLGADAYKPETVEVELSVPALTTTMVPDTKTVTYTIDTSATPTATWSSDQVLLSVVQTGGSSAGVAALTARVRVPSDCAQYLRGGVTLGADCTSSAAVSATLKVLF